jgi:hypothetical protein
MSWKVWYLSKKDQILNDKIKKKTLNEKKEEKEKHYFNEYALWGGV